MSTKIIYGTISSHGVIVSGTGFTVSRQDTGRYLIDFDQKFSNIPAVVGSQTGFEKKSEDTRDNVVFPYLTVSNATAITGDSTGSHTDRQFSFIAIGELA